MDLKQKEELDNYLSFILMNRLLQPIKKSKAFNAGLIDNAGKIIRQPKTEEEEYALSLFDKTIFYLKRVLGSKIGRLRDFAFVHMDAEEFEKKIMLRASHNKRAKIGIIRKKIDQMLEEELNTDLEGFVLDQSIQIVRMSRKPTDVLEN